MGLCYTSISQGGAILTEYNNLRQIREIYGATQDEIAKAVGVNRATISQWETGAAKASSANLEKLSIFYGIGPESFYELPKVDEKRKKMLISTAKRAQEIKEKSEKVRDKAVEFSALFEKTTFNKARDRFMLSMKMLLATADNGKLEDLKVAYDINQKMARRLDAIINIREEEEKAKEENNEDTLFDLLDDFSKDRHI